MSPQCSSTKQLGATLQPTIAYLYKHFSPGRQRDSSGEWSQNEQMLVMLIQHSCGVLRVACPWFRIWGRSTNGEPIQINTSTGGPAVSSIQKHAEITRTYSSTKTQNQKIESTKDLHIHHLYTLHVLCNSFASKPPPLFRLHGLVHTFCHGFLELPVH